MEDKELLESVEKSLFEEDVEYIKTGLTDLDYVLKSTEKPSLIAIVGRPSMGKTAFLTTILINLLKQKKKCLFFSFDLSSKIRLSNDFKRNIRAMLHQYCIYKFGINTGVKDLKYSTWNESKERSLWGYFSYIKQVDKKHYSKLLNYKEKLFKKYFLYSTP